MFGIVVADDHPLYRDGIRAALAASDDFSIIAEVGDGQGAINTARRIKIDIIILDINMPGVSGIEACRIIRREFPDIKIVILTADESEEKYWLVQQMGVSGYFLKNISGSTLISCLRKIVQAQPVPAPAFSKEILEEVKGVKDNFGLTPRELSILKGVAKGSSNRDIGISLYISEKTVKNHLSKIFRKMKVEDRTQAALKAVKLKMIDSDSK